MTPAQILEAAIEKAIEGGWKPPFPNVLVYVPGLNWIEFNDGSARHESLEPYSLIFNHEFAKGLWGEEKCDWDASGSPELFLDREWQLHLARMVLAPDPIAYLGEHLDGGGA